VRKEDTTASVEAAAAPWLPLMAASAMAFRRHVWRIDGCNSETNGASSHRIRVGSVSGAIDKMIMNRIYKRKTPATLTLTVLALSALPTLTAAASEWVESTGQDCDVSCAKRGETQVVSGRHPKLGDYFVCAADAAAEGLRAGYNLPAFETNKCIVGQGESEKAESVYYCLCK
jgi:hypothetical protein